MSIDNLTPLLFQWKSFYTCPLLFLYQTFSNVTAQPDILLQENLLLDNIAFADLTTTLVGSYIWLIDGKRKISQNLRISLNFLSRKCRTQTQTYLTPNGGSLSYSCCSLVFLFLKVQRSVAYI